MSKEQSPCANFRRDFEFSGEWQIRCAILESGIRYTGGGNLVREVLNEVQATEAESERIVAEARECAQNVVKEARQKAAALLKQAEDSAKQEVQDLILRTEQEAGKVAKEESTRASKETEQIVAAATQRLDQAAQLIVDKVVS